MVSLYWFTNSFPRCIYPYRNALSGRYGTFGKTDKPIGFSYFPRELTVMPESWAKVLYPGLIRYRNYKVSGPLIEKETLKWLLIGGAFCRSGATQVVSKRRGRLCYKARSPFQVNFHDSKPTAEFFVHDFDFFWFQRILRLPPYFASQISISWRQCLPRIGPPGPFCLHSGISTTAGKGSSISNERNFWALNIWLGWAVTYIEMIIVIASS